MIGEFWGLPHPDDRVPVPAQRDVSDEVSLHSMLEERLRHNPWLTTAEVTMNLLDGVVVLRGRVSSVEAQRALSEAAWTLPGIRDVSNQVEYPRG